MRHHSCRVGVRTTTSACCSRAGCACFGVCVFVCVCVCVCVCACEDKRDRDIQKRLLLLKYVRICEHTQVGVDVLPPHMHAYMWGAYAGVCGSVCASARGHRTGLSSPPKRPKRMIGLEKMKNWIAGLRFMSSLRRVRMCESERAYVCACERGSVHARV